MYYRLSSSQEKELLRLPESGMGYQIVDAKREGTDITAKFIVLNAEIAVEMNEAAPLYVKEIATAGFGNIIEKAMPFRWKIINVLQQDSELKPVSIANVAKPEFPDGGEIFVRRSLYQNDKRIDTMNNCLRAGSYTTTLPDSMKHRSSSDDPLIQLAMDHGVRGQWGFHIRPKRTDPLQRGKKDPQTGAKEVFFQNGTSYGTFLKREEYSLLTTD